MAFTPLTTTQVAPGQPVTGTLMGLIKTDLDDHQTRITTLEGGGSTVYPPIVLSVFGYYDAPGVQNDLVRTTCNFNLQIIGAYIITDVAGTSGTLQVDVKFKRPGATVGQPGFNWTSVFTTLPSIASTAGSDATSASGIMNTTFSTLLAGDLLRLDTTSLQTFARGFNLRLDFNKV